MRKGNASRGPPLGSGWQARPARPRSCATPGRWPCGHCASQPGTPQPNCSTPSGSTFHGRLPCAPAEGSGVRVQGRWVCVIRGRHGGWDRCRESLRGHAVGAQAAFSPAGAASPGPARALRPRVLCSAVRGTTSPRGSPGGADGERSPTLASPQHTAWHRLTSRLDARGRGQDSDRISELRSPPGKPVKHQDPAPSPQDSHSGICLLSKCPGRSGAQDPDRPLRGPETRRGPWGRALDPRSGGSGDSTEGVGAWAGAAIQSGAWRRLLPCLLMSSSSLFLFFLFFCHRH